MKKLLSLILSLVMIFCILVPGAETLSASAVSIDDSETVYPSFTSKIGNPEEALQEYVSDVQQFTDYIVPHIKNCETQVDVRSYQIAYSSAALKAISNYIYYYLVELYHVASVGVSISSGKIYHLTFSYKLSAEDYGRNFEKIETVCAKLLEGLDSSTLSDKDKALLIHDRLAQYCEYDYENYLNGTPGEYSSSIYGALAEGYAVCSGYARSYMYLLRQVGIKSYVTSSDTLSHEWNIVYLDGVKYHVDVTWDDPVRDIYGRVNHDSFLRSTQGISTDHNASDYDTSPVDTTYDSEYWQSSYTGFQLVNGEIFFFNSSSKTLCKVTDSGVQELASLPYKWYLPSGGYYSKSYVTLAGDGENLFFSTPKAIYRYDTATDTYEEYYAPELQNGFNIYGFKIKDGYFCLDINNSQSITSQDRANYSLMYYYRKTKITFNAEYNGGEALFSPTVRDYNPGDSIALTFKAQKTGWTFAGWSQDPDSTDVCYTYNVGTEDVTFYAIYYITYYERYIDIDGMSETPHKYYNEKSFDRTINLPELKGIEGWQSVGWCQNYLFGSNVYNDTYQLTGTVLFYALYKQSVNIRWHADGATNIPDDRVCDRYYFASTKYYNETVQIPEVTPVKPGYEFKGWSDNPGSSIVKYSVSDTFEASENKDLYAVFEPEGFNVYFNAQPGVCSTDSYLLYTGQCFGKLPVPVRDGYIFAGWYTESGDSITSETVFNYGRDITLYAKWNEALKIDPESGINSDSSFLYFESAEQLKNLNISSLFLNENVEVESNGEGNDSTGAIVTLKNDSGKIQDTRTVVLRGDVNGDLCVDARDSVIVNCIIGGMLTPHAAVLKAADTNTDGIVNVEDANNLVNKGLFKN